MLLGSVFQDEVGRELLGINAMVIFPCIILVSLVQATYIVCHDLTPNLSIQMLRITYVSVCISTQLQT